MLKHQGRQRKKEIKNTDVVIRCLRVKDKINLSRSSLKKEIKAAFYKTSATNIRQPNTVRKMLFAKVKNK